ncbi:MAG: alanine--glyoxylate aminotransferase family protein [Acidimicrobiia bacterium]|nr:alanine--glyoxylate aminotransferase family protein [Acidimicrobiia bacterium]
MVIDTQAAGRLLMGPGPSNAYPESLAAAGRPLIGHLDPVFLAILDDTSAGLRAVMGTDNELTFPISGTGSAGMEAAFVNWVAPGDVVVIGVNGVFGQRMCDVADRLGAEVVKVEHEWGEALSVERMLSAHPAPAIIAAVHAETSTGVLSDVASIGANKGDALFLVDCVTSVGGVPVELDAWGVDIAYSGTQKCLGVAPGLAPFTANERARERMLDRPVSWYLDLNMIEKYVTGEGARAYHHTAPINAIRGLHAGLATILAEGLDAVFERHRSCGGALFDGLMSLGFEPFAQEGNRIPHLTTAYLPEGVDDAKARRTLLEDFGIEVGGGLGPVAGKIWRVSAMGETARAAHVNTGLAAITAVVS